MSHNPIALNASSLAQPLHVIGVRVTVLASGEQTQGHELTLQEGHEGAGPPPHSHGWDEAFYVLSGSVDFTAAGRRMHGTRGSFFYVPANTVHAFSFGPQGGSMLEVAGPGSRATAMFASLDREIPSGPPDIPKVIGILREHGCELAT